MGAVLDLIVIAIVAFVIWRSAKHGFVRTIIELIGYVLAFYIAVTFSGPLAESAYTHFVEPSIQKQVEQVVTDTIGQSAADASSQIWENLPESVVNGAAKFGITQGGLTESLQSNMQGGSPKIAEAITDYVAKPVVVSALKALFTILLFLICLMLIRLLARVVNKAFELPLIGKVNHALGGILGIFKGVLIAAVFCIAVSTLVMLTKEGFWIFTPAAIADSHLFRYLSEFNPIYTLK